MADSRTFLSVGENSPEHVAYRLMHDIALVEGKVLHRNAGRDSTSADRYWILQTYEQCMTVVRGGPAPS